MAIEVYHGKYVTAEEAISYFDLATINDCCKTFNTVSEKLVVIANKIKTLQDICTKDAVSFGNMNMEDNIIEYEKSVRDLSLYLSDLASTIMNTTFRVINRKQVLLNEEAAHEDKEKERLDLDASTMIVEEG